MSVELLSIMLNNLVNTHGCHLATPTISTEQYERELKENGPPTPTPSTTTPTTPELVTKQPKYFDTDLTKNSLYRKRMARRKNTDIQKN